MQYTPQSRICIPQTPSPSPLIQLEQPKQTQEIQTQRGLSYDQPFYMFVDKNKEQRFLKPIKKQQLFELRQQDIIRKGSKGLSANRYDRKSNLSINNNFFPYIYK